MKFKELFEDKWTDAFSILTASKGLKDDEGIEILLKLLKATDDESGPTLSAPAWSRGGGDPKVGQSHVSREAVQQNLAGNPSTKAVDQKQQLCLQQQQEQKKQKHQEHDGHDEMGKSIVRKIIRNLKFQKALLNHKEITILVVQCLRLCCLMQAQYPPMVLDFSFRCGDVFHTDALDAFSTRGPTMAYLVWPPLRLHKDGPLVCKGYAEGLKK
ncbi:hypothetical protein MAR_022503 [Mya arenaria]|uniref:Mitochondria-eating protein C-terminal domain-containing protein n=1 Tax=Mya arenaria TaxID=6604 RepID=A0ABY7DN70_MYAAR|nr:hypothetical protein MAR_022503 [Mya arenaria]